MPNSDMKNIVVLKNLPSNLVDEAIVILKSNKNAKKLQHIEKYTSAEVSKGKNNDDYIIKEAENVISNYLAKIEKNRVRKFTSNIEKKYKKIKAYSIFITGILIFALIRCYLLKCYI